MDLIGNIWRFQFTERLEKVLDERNVRVPFLFILGNTPKYAGNLRIYPDENCAINWAFWIKEHVEKGYWFDQINIISLLRSNSNNIRITKKVENHEVNKT